jgi:hypothetical protein
MTDKKSVSLSDFTSFYNAWKDIVIPGIGETTKDGEKVNHHIYPLLFCTFD